VAHQLMSPGRRNHGPTFRCGSEEFALLRSHVNPRSTSGSVIALNDPLATVLHYKKASTARIEREATEIVRAQRSTRDVAGIAPVQLRACDAAAGILVTYRIERAHSLFNYLWNGTSVWRMRSLTTNDISTIGLRIGSWLRAYHESSLRTIDDASPFVGLVAADIRRKLDVLQRDRPRSLDGRVIDRLRDYLAGVDAGVSSWSRCGVATIHRDMGFSNLLIDENGDLFVLDFADAREGLAWEDVARVWHGLWGISQLSARRARLLCPSMTHLLSAYGDGIDISSHPLFTFLRCWNAVTAILVHALFGQRLGVSGWNASRRIARVNQRWIASLTP